MGILLVNFWTKGGKRMTKVSHYAFPGGYPLFYYVESYDGKFHSCPSCVNQNRIGKNVDCCKGHINYEDETLTCDVCEKQIESAYGKECN
jgi:hypothetical protein